MTDWRPPPPPDAGSSYLGTYGFSPWTLWIMRHAPELVAETPAALTAREGHRPCPDCRWPMARRPGGWKCYRHEPPIIVMEEPKFERAPKVDVLSRVNEALDIVYVDGEWRVRELNLEAQVGGEQGGDPSTEMMPPGS